MADMDLEAQNVLVVDWDYFFPTPEGDPDITFEQLQFYDWGHSEQSIGDWVWSVRASAFDKHNKPRPQMNDEWKTFWDRFDIDEDATLYFANSNSQAAAEEVRHSLAPRTAKLWLYDAHHDSGYGARTVEEVIKSGRVYCDDWMIGYHHWEQSELHVRYPRWKPWAMEVEGGPDLPEEVIDRQVDDGEPNPTLFHAVFVCRSDSWVPPWCDEQFQEFIYSCHTVNELYCLDEKAQEPRPWDEAAVAQHIEAEKMALEMWKRDHPESSDT
jgi:hypothetical protein